MKILHLVAFILLVIGGLNWGVMAIDPTYNVVEMVLGGFPMVVRLVYALVGLSAIILVATCKGGCKACASSCSPEGM